MEEMRLLILTDRGLLLRKSSVQVQIEVAVAKITEFCDKVVRNDYIKGRAEVNE